MSNLIVSDCLKKKKKSALRYYYHTDILKKKNKNVQPIIKKPFNLDPVFLIRAYTCSGILCKYYARKAMSTVVVYKDVVRNKLIVYQSKTSIALCYRNCVEHSHNSGHKRIIRIIFFSIVTYNLILIVP